jgi:hypothetical protein
MTMFNDDSEFERMRLAHEQLEKDYQHASERMQPELAQAYSRALSHLAYQMLSHVEVNYATQN